MVNPPDKEHRWLRRSYISRKFSRRFFDTHNINPDWMLMATDATSVFVSESTARPIKRNGFVTVVRKPTATSPWNLDYKKQTAPPPWTTPYNLLGRFICFKCNREHMLYDPEDGKQIICICGEEYILCDGHWWDSHNVECEYTLKGLPEVESIE